MKKVIIGITGSISAFKVIQLISDLTKEDYEVEVLLTHAATQFVTPVSIQALTKRKVYVDVFDDDPSQITHVDIVKDADVFVVVPASATTIAKLAHGIADNMLTAAALAATCPKVIAPGMNVHMYENVVTQRNIHQLVEDGYEVIEPVEGLLACGDTGKGKLVDMSVIKERIVYLTTEKTLLHKKVLITAGPTQESLDPVRFITNHSSGKMGYALARQAWLKGADVTLISGPVNLTNENIRIIPITTAQNLYDAVKENYEENDYIIMSAAVADYTPTTTSNQKIKKHDETLTLELKKTPDSLQYVGLHKTHQIVCGFAMETENLIENAKEKLIKKNCDMIIANSLNEQGAGFGVDTNIVHMISLEDCISLPVMSKDEVAGHILNQCIEMEMKKSVISD